jgi:flagellar basal body-associated protein FliL
MSDKKEKPKDSKADPAAKTKPSPLAMLTKLPVLLGLVMTLEAAALLVGFKLFMSGGPQSAEAVLLVPADSAKDGAEKDASAKGDAKGDAKAADHGAAGDHAAPAGGPPDAHGGAAAHGASGHAKGQPVEVSLVDIRAPNKLSGRTFIYDVSVFAVVKEEKAEEFKAAVKAREASIRDRLRTIIAQLHPDKLGGGNEPGLETLRRQIRYQMEDIAGEGVIVEILVARCIPFRADF